MLKKELICYTSTLEEGEFTKVNAIEGEPGYFLLSLGQQRIIINGHELMEAMSSIDYYATLFKQESLAREQRAKAPAKAVVVTAPTKRAKKSNEEEGTIELEAVLRTGPTASEVALEKQTKHMNGETLVFKEK